ncbi:uncharacterized protein SCHCODRAFT_01342490 [Schizophyllum commune H4-8]|uniref:uncharacterized protein n=1 Tax=Schizophyllum commune (strain H4-8 / FGSC 9210) TaxID=578458 RepID=UPI00215E5E52|nr:uncharacterized protein SCHCODRAFT_01342490 [Schizophyllum commune H4-8]KAI5885589.1 hypothetical protein SCHCODRAFT_01342490 [Schizophyllum commune H4-8]
MSLLAFAHLYCHPQASPPRPSHPRPVHSPHLSTDSTDPDSHHSSPPAHTIRVLNPPATYRRVIRAPAAVVPRQMTRPRSPSRKWPVRVRSTSTRAPRLDVLARARPRSLTAAHTQDYRPTPSRTPRVKTTASRLCPTRVPSSASPDALPPSTSP